MASHRKNLLWKEDFTECFFGQLSHLQNVIWPSPNVISPPPKKKLPLEPPLACTLRPIFDSTLRQSYQDTRLRKALGLHVEGETTFSNVSGHRVWKHECPNGREEVAGMLAYLLVNGFPVWSIQTSTQRP